MKHSVRTRADQDDTPTIPAAPFAKRRQSGVRRRSELDMLLLDYLEEETRTPSREMLAAILARQMREE